MDAAKTRTDMLLTEVTRQRESRVWRAKAWMRHLVQRARRARMGRAA